MHPSALPGSIASFGPFRLHASERFLEKHGKPLKIGSRGLDILLTLLEHAPEIVAKRELIRRAWRKLVVDEVSLRVHVAALRKRLGDKDSSSDYIKNVPGRGYCFAGAVTWAAAAKTQTNTSTTTGLPREPLLMIGRDDLVPDLTAQLKNRRFLSIVGAGGIGKTTIALTLAHRLLSEFRGAVQRERALGIIDEGIEWCEIRVRAHERLNLLCVKGQILIEGSPNETREGEACLLRILDAARKHGLLALELRIGITLARLWRSQGLIRRAIELISSLSGRFAEGSETRDLKRAACLLEELHSNRGAPPS